jgi:hypothetical protein
MFPGEHVTAVDDGKAYLERYGKDPKSKGWYSFVIEPLESQHWPDSLILSPMVREKANLERSCGRTSRMDAGYGTN